MVPRINLIPPSDRKRTETDIGSLILVVVAVVVLGSMGFFYWNQQSVLQQREDELADVRAQIRQIQTQLAELSQYEALQQERETTETLVQNLYAGRTLLSRLVSDVSLLVPDNVWFSSLTIEAGTIPPAGAAGEGGEPAPVAGTTGSIEVQGKTYAYEDVARFMVRLEEVPALQGVLLGNATQPRGETAGNETTQFQMGAAVANTQSPETPLPLTQVHVAQGDEQRDVQ